MKLSRVLPALLTCAAPIAGLVTCAAPRAALAQTSYLSPDGRNRFPAVTIFCPSGTGVAPCSFSGGGGGGGGGAVSINLGGQAVSASNRLPVTDSPLDGLISGGALSIAGTVGLSGAPTVTLGTGTNQVGAVSISNFPATQAVSGAISQSGAWNVGLSTGTNAIGSVSVSNFPATQPVSGAISQSGAWNVGLSTGTNAIGSVSVSNFPATQPVSGAISQSGTWNVGLSAGTNAIGSVSVANFPATQPVSGSVTLSTGTSAIGSVTVSNLPATQAISAATLPLPAGAATAAAQTAPLATVAPAAATATNSMIIGCTANTTLPSFTAGQQGAVPCDTSGRPYVVTVPSANNVPGYLQAVASGGASVYRAINAASSAMAANVKSNTGMVYGYEACNNGTAAAFLRLFATGGTPNVGASTPLLVKLLPAGICQTFSTAIGLVFANGIGVDATSGSMADTDTTVIAAASQISVSVYYK